MITEHKILVGDCRETLKTLPAESAHCCVTSPPYWGLRDYQTESPKEIGSEPTLNDHLANIVDVYREVRRVLRPDALSFLNYGDAFNSVAGNYRGDPQGIKLDGGTKKLLAGNRHHYTKRNSGVAGFKQKDLMLLPHRVAMALQADGWYLRQCVIWCKGSPMPESVRGSRWERCRVKVGNLEPDARDARWGGSKHDARSEHSGRTGSGNPHREAVWQPCPGCDKCRDTDGYIYRQSAGRPTTAHEFVFLLSKSPSYYYAMDENRVASHRESSGNVERKFDHINGRQGVGHNVPWENNGAGRNLWSYWTDISPSAFKDSHFATMPLDLARRCIKLGTSSVGVCSACGAPWAPVVDVTLERQGDVIAAKAVRGNGSQKPLDASNNRDGMPRGSTQTNILAHRPTCTCNADKSPAVVLDPFGGAGTTAIAARELGHSSVICELNNEYAAMAKRRSRRHFSKPKAGTAVKPATGQVELF